MKATHSFLLVCILSIIPLTVLNLFIIEEIDYINFYSGKVSVSVLEELISAMKKWKWIGIPISALILFIKTTIVASIIWLGVYLTKTTLPYQQIWKNVIFAQLVFSLKGYFLLFLALFNSDFNLELIYAYHPLSLTSLFQDENIETYLTLIFQSLNLFEVAYWFLLAYFISKELKGTFNDGLKVVVSSYIPAFALWLVTITFLLVSNS